MLRIGKLSDYAIVLLTWLANGRDGVRSAASLASDAQLPCPTVSKILKALHRAGLLTSVRGNAGGYALARPASDISVAAIIQAIEGPIALTECDLGAERLCELEPVCPVRGHWRHISAAVRGALEQLTLADMTRPPSAALPPLSIRSRKNEHANRA